VRVNTTAESELFGGGPGAQAQAKANADLHGAGMQLFEEAKNVADDAVVRDTDNRANAIKLNLLNGMVGKDGSRSGGALSTIKNGSSGITTTTMEDYNEQMKILTKDMSAVQQSKFKVRDDARRTSMQNNLSAHENKEIRKYQIEVDETAGIMAVQSASLDYTPANVEAQAGEINESLYNAYQREGLSEDNEEHVAIMDKRDIEGLSPMYTAAIQSALQDNNTGAAQNLFDKYKTSMTKKDRDKILAIKSDINMKNENHSVSDQALSASYTKDKHGNITFNNRNIGTEFIKKYMETHPDANRSEITKLYHAKTDKFIKGLDEQQKSLIVKETKNWDVTMPVDSQLSAEAKLAMTAETKLKFKKLEANARRDPVVVAQYKTLRKKDILIDEESGNLLWLEANAKGNDADKAGLLAYRDKIKSNPELENIPARNDLLTISGDIISSYRGFKKLNNTGLKHQRMLHYLAEDHFGTLAAADREKTWSSIERRKIIDQLYIDHQVIIKDSNSFAEFLRKLRGNEKEKKFQFNKEGTNKPLDRFIKINPNITTKRINEIEDIFRANMKKPLSQGGWDVQDPNEELMTDLMSIRINPKLTKKQRSDLMWDRIDEHRRLEYTKRTGNPAPRKKSK
jgi:hypothetical protein